MTKIKLKNNQMILAELPPEHPTLKLIWFIGYFFGLSLFEKKYVYEEVFSREIGHTTYMQICYRTIRHPLDQDYFKNYF